METGHIYASVHVLADEIQKARCPLKVSPVLAPDCSHLHLSAPLVKGNAAPRRYEWFQSRNMVEQLCWVSCQDLGINVPYSQASLSMPYHPGCDGDVWEYGMVSDAQEHYFNAFRWDLPASSFDYSAVGKWLNTFLRSQT